MSMKKVWKKMMPLLAAISLAFAAGGVTAGADPATADDPGTLSTRTVAEVTTDVDNVVTNSAEVMITGGNTGAKEITFDTYQVIYATYIESSNSFEWHLTDWAKTALDEYNTANPGASLGLDDVIAAIALSDGTTKTTGNLTTEQSEVVNVLAAYIATQAAAGTSVTTVSSGFSTITAGSGDDSTATLPVGSYLVLAHCENMSFLNMMVSVDVSATTGTTSSDWKLAAKNAVLKGTPISITKTVDDASTQVGAGGIVTYTLTVAVPQFAANDGTHEFYVLDTATNLDIKEDTVVVKAYSSGGGAGVELTKYTDGATSYNYKVTSTNTPDTGQQTGSKLTIDFTEKYFSTFYADSSASYPYTYITITYDAELLSSAETTGSNVAELNYSSDSNTGKASANQTVYTYQMELTKSPDSGTDNLPDAEFKVYYYDDNGNAVQLTFVDTGSGVYKVADSTYAAADTVDHITTNADGTVTLIGLNDQVTYYIEESKAPSGYTLNTNVLEFTIVETSAGTISTVSTTEYTAPYVAGGSNTVLAIGATGSWTETDPSAGGNMASFSLSLKDTKIAALPATGSIGIIVFTIAGVAIMILALILINGGKSKEKAGQGMKR